MKGKDSVKGLALARAYFERKGMPMIQALFPDRVQMIAAGLSGDGSECFGFDDDISRDHDWGPGFCLWLSEKAYAEIGGPLQRAYETLPKTFEGFERRESQWGGHRVGVLEIRTFFRKYTGLSRAPKTPDEWRRIPEQNLAACTNGAVFYDPLKAFSTWRNRLLAFYPEDVRCKKIAFRCMMAAQSGQYNFPRLLKRKEPVAQNLAQARFILHSTALAFLLHRRYMPFYKWAHRALGTLSPTGENLAVLMTKVVESSDDAIKIQGIETICALLIGLIREQGLSGSSSDFLLDHGPNVRACIKDRHLRAEDTWMA